MPNRLVRLSSGALETPFATDRESAVDGLLCYPHFLDRPSRLVDHAVVRIRICPVDHDLVHQSRVKGRGLQAWAILDQGLFARLLEIA